MLNRKKQIYILSSIILVLLFLLFLLLAGEGARGEKTGKEQSQTKLTGISEDEIYSIQVVNQKDSYILKNINGGFRLEGADNKSYSAESIKSFIKKVCNTVPEYKFKAEPSELKLYGLDNPNAEMRIKLFDSSEITFDLGNELPTEERFYLRGNEYIYVIDNYFAGLLNKNRLLFHSINLFPELSEKTIDRINMFSVYDRNRRKRTAVDKKENSYRLSYPFETFLDWQVVYSSLFYKILSVKDVELVSISHDYWKYGLDDPDCFFEIGYGSDIHHYQVKLGRERSVISSEGSDEIYSIPTNYLAFLTADYFELIRNGLYKRNITTLSEINVIYNDNTFVFNIEGSGEKLKIQSGSRIISIDKFLPLYRQISSLSPLKGKFPSDIKNDSVLKIVFISGEKSSQNDVIELVPFSERECLIIINGKPTVKTYIKTVNEIVASIKAVVE